MPSGKVRATGIPIGFEFTNPRTRNEAITSLGLNPQKKTIFVLHGLTGRTKTASVVKELVATKRPDIQLLVGIGKGEQVKDEVEAVLRRSQMQYKLYGFIDDMANKLAATDLIITKPGGLIVSECLAMHVPMLLINPTPGQEEANAIFLLERGVAMYLRNVTSLAYKLNLMLDDPSHYRRIKDRLFAIGKPNASLEIAMDVVQIVSRKKAGKEV
ncbi:MAG TPA: glycosyltransferase [Patescibacteria group bacterium]|nr:glycosyltransferase [Patescibacteria group bacterium]